MTSEWYRRDGELHSTLPPLDQEQTGWGPLYRLYQCLTGWICVAAVSDAHAAATIGTVAPALVGDERFATLEACAAEAEALTEALTYELFAAPAEDWVERLRAVGVPCEVVVEDSWYLRFLADDAMVEAGLAAEIVHPVHGRARTVGQVFHLRHRPGVDRDRAPLLGEHSAPLLAELGFEQAEVSSLLDAGVVRQAERESATR